MSADIRVNTYIADQQAGSDITALSGGGWVATWTSYGQDGDGNGIYQQVYDAAGDPVGAETRVNTYTSDGQDGPVVMALPTGGWIVVWNSYEQDGDSYGVYQQAYDASGDPLGGEVQVSTFTADSQAGARVAVLSGGGWVVTWTSQGQDGDGNGVYLQAYDADGDPVGTEVRVNTTTADEQLGQQIVALAGGGFVVTWQSYHQDGSASGIYQQVYDANGDPQGGETRVNTHTGSAQTNQKTVALSNGGWVVAWQSSSQDGSGEGLYQQVYDANGSPVGGEVQINTYTDDDQVGHQLVTLAGGGWVVAWYSEDQDGSGGGIYQQAYDVNGDPVGGEARVNTYTNGYQGDGRVTALPDGGWVVAWSSEGQDGSGSGIYQQAYDAGGDRVGGEIRLNTTTAGAQGGAMVAALQDGGWAVTWHSYEQGQYDVYQRHFSVQSGDADANELTGGAGSEYLYGYGGDDILIGGGGVNELIGGDGNDRLESLSSARDFIDGGAGTDLLVLDFSALSADRTIDIGTGSGTLPGATRFTSIERLFFTGGSGNDDAVGAGFDDILIGGAGDDYLDGAGGTNALSGGAGDDRVYVADDGGVNAIDGGADSDRLELDRASSTLDWVIDFRTPGALQALADGSTLVGVEHGNLTLGSGDDTVFNGAYESAVFAGDGDDELTGTGGRVDFHGEAGDDSLTGSAVGDYLDGGTGDDTLDGGLGDDQLYAGSGDDRLYSRAGHGPDYLEGGSGIDFAFVDRSTSTRSMTIDIADSTIQVAVGDGSFIRGIERIELRAGSGNDTLTGGALADILIGNAGRDMIDGGGGADTVSGGDGTDILDGGAGDDTINGGAGIDIIDGSAGHDIIDGGLGNDMLAGDAGDDTIDGGSGIDTMDGGLGDDIFVVNHARDAVFEDVGQGTDTVQSTITLTLDDNIERLTLLGSAAIGGTGNSLANLITGNGAGNLLSGLAGNDALSGQGGADILIGGAGKDTLTGGAGNDVFRFLAKTDSLTGANADIITDFGDSGADKIDLSALFSTTLVYRHNLAFNAAGQVRINDVAGADVIVEVNLSGTSGAEMAIRLTGTALANMNSSDFVL